MLLSKPSILNYLTRFLNRFKSFTLNGASNTDMLSFLMKENKLAGSEFEKEVECKEMDLFPFIVTEEQAVSAFRYVWDLSLMELQERLYAIYLDRTNKLLGYTLISTGSTNVENAHPNLILSYASELSASKVIVAHNHPSGVNMPSASDKQYTTLLEKACKKADVELISHIIITSKSHCSISLS